MSSFLHYLIVRSYNKATFLRKTLVKIGTPCYNLNTTDSFGAVYCR